MLINVTIAGIYYGLSFSNLGMVFSYLKLTWLMISLGGFENSCRFAVLWGYRLGQNPRPCHGVGAEGRGWLGQLKQLNRGWRFWFGTSVLMYMCMHMYVYIYIHIHIHESYTQIPWLVDVCWCLYFAWPCGFRPAHCWASQHLMGPSDRSCHSQLFLLQEYFKCTQTIPSISMYVVDVNYTQ